MRRSRPLRCGKPSDAEAETSQNRVRVWHGLYALVPKERADVGSTRAIPPHVVDLLCQRKDDEPAPTIPLLIKRVREEHSALISDEVVLADPTVHRLLARHGLMRKPSDPTSKDDRRFEYDAAGAL